MIHFDGMHRQMPTFAQRKDEIDAAENLGRYVGSQLKIKRSDLFIKSG